MIHGGTRFIYALLLAAPFFVEGAQAAIEARAHVLTARQLVKGSPTSSSTSTSATPTTINFFLGDFPQPTSCGSTRLSWVYTGTADSLSLQVSNVGVAQGNPSSSSSSTSSSNNAATSIIGRAPTKPFIRSDITLTIATNLTSSSDTFLWDPVNVPAGQYIISAVTPGIPVTQDASSFFVRAGTDTSCLAAISSSATSASSTITSSSVNTAASIVSQSAASTSVSTTLNAVNVPLIVGVTIGMAAFVIAVVVLWLCLYRKAKSHRRGGRLNTFAHRWNGLGSADSRAGLAAKATKQKYQSSRSHLHSHPDSVASTMGPDFDGAVAEKSTTQLNHGKTSNLSDEQGVALSTLPVLYHQSQRTRPTRTHSESSSASNVNVFGMNNHGTSPVKGPSAQRSSQKRPSIDTSANPQHSQQTSQQSFSSSVSQPPPISPSAAASREIKQMHRQSLGRKRKPVPVYDPDQGQPASATSPTFAPPLPSSTTNGDSAAFPTLTHKSSFGPGGIEGKPLHYLIPDMPMPPANP